MFTLKENGLWRKLTPEELITWDLYAVMFAIFILHTLDVGLTFFGITLGFAEEGNTIVIMVIQRMGLILTMFFTWIGGLVVTVIICWVGYTLERIGHYFPIPTFFLLLFLLFVTVLKAMVVAWNITILMS